MFQDALQALLMTSKMLLKSTLRNSSQNRRQNSEWRCLQNEDGVEGQQQELQISYSLALFSARRILFCSSHIVELVFPLLDFFGAKRLFFPFVGSRALGCNELKIYPISTIEYRFARQKNRQVENRLKIYDASSSTTWPSK